MGDVLSFVAVAVLLVLIVVSIRRQRAESSTADAELNTRAGTDNAQQKRAEAHRAKVRAERG